MTFLLRFSFDHDRKRSGKKQASISFPVGCFELETRYGFKDFLFSKDCTNVNGKLVAVFGLGDQSGFADTYCDAMGILARTAKSRGANLIGETSAEGYGHSSSAAAEDGMFCGLALDDNNESEKTSSRIGAWVEKLKSHLG